MKTIMYLPGMERPVNTERCAKENIPVQIQHKESTGPEFWDLFHETPWGMNHQAESTILFLQKMGTTFV